MIFHSSIAQQTDSNPDLIKDQVFLFCFKNAIIDKTEIERTNADF